MSRDIGAELFTWLVRVRRRYRSIDLLAEKGLLLLERLAPELAVDDHVCRPLEGVHHVGLARDGVCRVVGRHRARERPRTFESVWGTGLQFRRGIQLAKELAPELSLAPSFQ